MKKILSIVLILCSMSVLVSYADTGEWYSQPLKQAVSAGLASEEVALSPGAPLTSDALSICLAKLDTILNGGSVTQLDAAGAREYLYSKGYGSYAAINTASSVKRGDFALLMAAVTKDILPAINDNTTAPDVLGTQYFDAVITLYNSGIMTGLDSAGTFLPESEITNAQALTVMTRVINTFDRKSQHFVTRDSREAFYLIDDFLMEVIPRGKNIISSGWTYDFSGDININTTGLYQNTLDDVSENSAVSISRDFFPQSDGVLTLELVAKLYDGNNGVRIYFTDENGNNVSEIFTKDAKIYGKGNTEKKFLFSSVAEKAALKIKIVLDLDNGTTEVFSNGTRLGSFDNAISATAVNCLNIATTDEAIVKLTVNNVHLYKNYSVNEVFRVYKPYSAIPASSGWQSTGSVEVRDIFSNASNTGDVCSALINGQAGVTSSSKKTFDPLTGLVRAETFVLLPTVTDGAFVRLGSGDKTVLSIDTQDSAFVMGDTVLRKFTPNIWQLVHIEADLDRKTALVRIDGKTVAENVKIDAEYIDSIEIGFAPETDAYMWFDDVEVNNLYRYADYVPEPKPLQTDYILSMSICNLWRNGSHYGWECISPYDELTPVTGYYDEGNVEAMDWEIKYLVEHGISTYHMCWYAPLNPAETPIKKPRMIDAFHDGYFNSKYSDYLDFSIMFENQSQITTTIEQFKEHIWAYWKEWYFTDERYFLIDGKPYLTIYDYTRFVDNMCQGKVEKAKELIAWMREDIKTIGYDDIIITFSSLGNEANKNAVYAQLGIDGLIGYAVGSSGYDLDINKRIITTGFNTAKSSGVDALALAGTGFNIIGWDQKRTPLMTPSDFTSLLTWMRDEHLKNFDENSWKSKFIQFDTWNEYGEGHYLYPTNTYGFEYLDSIAEVFAKDPASYSKEVNTVPTQAQKDRLNRLYPMAHTQLRRNFLESVDRGLPSEVVKSYDFKTSSGASILSTGNLKDIGYVPSSDGGYFRGTTNKTDSMLWVGKSSDRDVKFSADETEVIHIKVWFDTPVTPTIYFTTDSDSNWNEAKSLRFDVKQVNQYVDYYVNTDNCAMWKGGICGFRFDPGDIAGVKFRLQTIEALKYPADKQPFKITVDNNLVNLAYDEAVDVDEYEMYTSLRMDTGIMTMLHLAYKWNRVTGILNLKSPSGTLMTLTVGSDTALVNGNSVKLDKPVSTFDGIPTVPLIFILKTMGYDYTYNPKEKTLNVWVLSNSMEKEGIVNGDAQGEEISFYSNIPCISVLPVTDRQKPDNRVWSVTGDNQRAWAYFRTSLKYEKGAEYVVNFDIRIDGLHNQQPTDKVFDVAVNARYYDSAATDLERIHDHSQTMANVSVADGWTHVSRTFTVADTYLYDENVVKDEIAVFVAPVLLDDGSYTTVDYSIDNFSVHKKAEPFVVINGDAEGTQTSAFYSGSSNVAVSVASDPSDSSNNVWYAENSNVTGQSWTYIRQNAKYKPGHVYEIEFDYRVMALSDGTAAKDVVIAFNARYVDTSRTPGQEREFDHVVEMSKISTADGWRHAKIQFRISPYYSDSASATGLGSEQLTFFANPVNNEAGTSLGVSFMLDNINVRIV